MRRVTAAAVLTAIVLAGCGPSAESTTWLEAEIRDGVSEQLDLEILAVVDCPTTVEQTTGSTFECFARDRASDDLLAVLKVTFTSEDEYQWRTVD